jgi:ADP-heptose:LPS heptosyltransferase
VFVKIKNLFNFFLFIFILPLLGKKKTETINGTLLLIRLDSIGDYVLFRNFIKIIKESAEYNNYKITLCGNIIWKDLAENFDKDVVDNFIWIDREKFYSNLFYKYRTLKQIHDYGFEVAVETAYSREILFDDEIIKVSGAKERIGSKGSPDKHAKWKRNLFTDKYYTRLIEASSENIFEFYRDKEFFGELLREKIQLTKPVIDASHINLKMNLIENFIVLFVGAKDSKRRWKPLYFSRVAEHIINRYNYKIIIPGTEEEKDLVREVLTDIKSENCLDVSGNLSLSQVARLISDSSLLISNETSAVHIAAAVNTKFICISNGNHLGRFNPYPAEVYNGGYYIYPEEIMKKIQSRKAGQIEDFRFNSELDINEIKPVKVLSLIDQVLIPKDK